MPQKMSYFSSFLSKLNFCQLCSDLTFFFSFPFTLKGAKKLYGLMKVSPLWCFRNRTTRSFVILGTALSSNPTRKVVCKGGFFKVFRKITNSHAFGRDFPGAFSQRLFPCAFSQGLSSMGSCA